MIARRSTLRGAMLALVVMAALVPQPSARGALLDYEYGGALAQLGRLRMLLERLSKQNVLYQLHLAEQSKVQIIETAHMIQQTLDLLREGRALMTVPEPPSPAIREQLRVVESAWVPLQRMALASPFDYLRRSREFIDPKDDRGDPLMILHFDGLAQKVADEANEAASLYIAECKRSLARRQSPPQRFTLCQRHEERMTVGMSIPELQVLVAKQPYDRCCADDFLAGLHL